MTTYLQFSLITCYRGLPYMSTLTIKMWIWLYPPIHRVNLKNFTLVSKIKLSFPNWHVCHMFMQNSYNPSHPLQTLSAGLLRGRSELHAFSAAVWCPAAVSTFITTHTVSRKNKAPSLCLGTHCHIGNTHAPTNTNTRAVSRVKCFSATLYWLGPV